MKQNILYILIVTLSLSSCSYLDLDPIDYYADGSYWENKEQVDAFMTSIHKRLRDDNTSMMQLGELRSEINDPSAASISGESMDNTDMKRQLIDEDHPGFSGWAGYYSDIFQINEALYKLEHDVDFLTDDEKNYYYGQLHGIRALYYFHLYRSYGGFPIETDPDVANGVHDPSQLYVARSSATESLQFLKDEIAASEKGFANDDFSIVANRDYWNKAATLMLKAQVYLWAAKVSTADYKPNNIQADLQTADKALDAITASGKFFMEESWDDALGYEHKGNNEIIMASHYELDEASFAIRGKYAYADVSFVGFYDADGNEYHDPLHMAGATSLSQLRNAYTLDLYNSFLKGDPRQDFNFLPAYRPENPDDPKSPMKLQGVVFKKMLGTIDTDQRSYVDDWPLFRYPELLLMKAEIANMQGGDVAVYINQIRERAYGSNDFPHYVNSDTHTNELAIYQEYNYEFLFEGKAWYNEIRMHGSDGSPLVFELGTLSKSDSHKLVLPIDVNTQSKNPLIKQNPGY